MNSYIKIERAGEMDDLIETPTKRKYPRRNVKKVNYEDFEMSMEMKLKQKKILKKDDSSSDEDLEDDEKENDITSEIEHETEEISEYEKLRLKNLEENRRMMLELGLINPKKEASVIQQINTKHRKQRKQKATVLHKSQMPMKRSLRLQGMTPEGKERPFELFQDSPLASPEQKEVKTRIEEEVLPMSESGESTDFLDGLKESLSQESTISSEHCLDNLIKDLRNLKLTAVAKVNKYRIQSTCIHPLENKLLVVSGSTDGELGLWNVSEGEVAQFKPHVRPINRISVEATDPSKLFTTSHDGTVRRGDLNKCVFNLVYQTDEKSNFCHITWHDHMDPSTLLVAHGTGEVAVVDLRTNAAQCWYHCHPRSVRTVHLHPSESHYFLSSSGIGECKIWDLRSGKKHIDQYLAELSSPTQGKGLTSAFFSPDGTRIVTTCNDDFLRFYDTTDLANPKEAHKVMHDNHTGRWLSVFKAIWHPRSSDLVFVGSMLQPRRVQLYSGTGQLMRELKGDLLTTIVPVIALHPTLPVVVGGNSSGKEHVFTTSSLSTQLVKSEDDDSF